MKRQRDRPALWAYRLWQKVLLERRLNTMADTSDKQDAAPAQSHATPSEVAHADFDALTKRDLDAVMESVAAEAMYDFVAVGEFVGKSAIRRFLEELLAALPDYAITVERVVSDRSTAVVQWHAEGTFSGGKFQGIEPTGKQVKIRGVDVMEITEGQIRHNTIYYDGASFARQIGLLPPSGSGTDKAMLSVFNAVTRLRQQISEHSHRKN
jgi:steroid delta-isomerase-like uncharacterized protein